MATAAIDGMGKLFDFMALPRTHAGKVQRNIRKKITIFINIYIYFRMECLRGCCVYLRADTQRTPRSVHGS